MINLVLVLFLIKKGPLVPSAFLFYFTELSFLSTFSLSTFSPPGWRGQPACQCGGGASARREKSQQWKGGAQRHKSVGAVRSHVVLADKNSQYYLSSTTIWIKNLTDLQFMQFNALNSLFIVVSLPYIEMWSISEFFCMWTCVLCVFPSECVYVDSISFPYKIHLWYSNLTYIDVMQNKNKILCNYIYKLLF